jgi:hypothetical protein
MTVSLASPDAFIARSSVEQFSRTGKVDVLYVGGLSADAQFWKIELYKKLEGEDKKIMRELLQKQKENLEKDRANWQSANLSRARALRLLLESGI